ncbi:MAG: hypothetical protein ACK5NB_08980 [Flavobacteriaceae bacterium]
MIFTSKYMVPKGYTGMALFPFIVLKEKQLKHDAVLVNHERIHLRQQLELLVLPFYAFYIIEFLFRLVYCRNWKTAYRSLSFEREAYANQQDLDYLKHRPFWCFLKYICGHDVPPRKKC